MLQIVYQAIRGWFTMDGAQFGGGFESDNDLFACYYRGDKDTNSRCRCAAGCLIADQFYDPALEKKLVSDESVRVAIAKSFGWEALPTDVYVFIYEAQHAHDQAAENEAELRVFIADLDSLARELGLVTPA